MDLNGNLRLVFLLDYHFDRTLKNSGYLQEIGQNYLSDLFQFSPKSSHNFLNFHFETALYFTDLQAPASPDPLPIFNARTSNSSTP